MNLPLDFTNKMQQMLKSEYEDFINSYNHPHHSALRLNPFKTTDFIKKLLE